MTPKGSEPPSGLLLRRWRGWLVMVPGLYVAGLVASVLYGTSARLPGVALGFPVLLHLERAGAILAVMSGVAIFSYMTSLGHLPSQFGNVIGYSIADRQDDLQRVTAELEQEIERRLVPLEESSRASDELLPVIMEQLTALDRRVDTVETRPLT
jgi:hypothetical protein